MWAFVKGIAVELKLLEPLVAESELVEGLVDFKAKHVDEGLISMVTTARKMAETCLLELDEDQRNGAAIAEMLERQKLVLTSADKHWAVEHGFWVEMASDTGSGRYAQKILDLLPSKVKAVSFVEAQNGLRALKASALGRYCGRAIASNLDTILGWVATGMHRQMVKMPRIGDGLLKQARQRSFFSEKRSRIRAMTWRCKSTSLAMLPLPCFSIWRPERLLEILSSLESCRTL